ncbi:9800_t:CDS:2 [Entrophospora sp. SA101]|nr:8208_t:CDS:2 [Entrophospora sp. SA101]CAJ0757368.1 9800_t:CDS:2 [Entrophospora sp. SA101]CAJ0843748.1 7591_t:CDS:2 [Entrophospora sp. SA101]CAJ0878540.1 7130_t:CDS:2 [Entrophospora sp. SA101]CAJ0907224.1 19865_t:CDS:2 [Entrophospora sp. SA101]
MVNNIGVKFKSIPHQYPVIGEHIEVVHNKINIDSYPLKQDELLVKNLYISLDPYMRGRMRSPEIKSYIHAFTVGEILEAGGISEVIKSNNPKYKVGDLYSGMVGWEEYSVITAKNANQNAMFTEGLNAAKSSNIPLSYFLGILGMPGMTAYTGLFKIGQPKKDETIFVSTAAGAVGQVVCQISKMLGLCVIVDFLLNEMKLDGAFNYKKYDLKKKLDELCPNGIDIYWDNVGGETLDVTLLQLNKHARVISCGMISQYNVEEPYSIKNIMCVLTKSLLIQGFIVFDYYDEMYEKFLKEMNEWLKSSKLKYKEDVVEGIEKAPEAFLGLLNGKNFGKLVVKVDKNTKL